MPRLFSYGSLQGEGVQRAIFGRTVESLPDAAIGFRLASIKITDIRSIAISGTDMHKIAEATHQASNEIVGAVLLITDDELKLADAYEDAAYKRVRAQLRSGLEAWIYAKA